MTGFPALLAATSQKLSDGRRYVQRILTYNVRDLLSIRVPILPQRNSNPGNPSHYKLIPSVHQSRGRDSSNKLTSSGYLTRHIE